MPTQECRLNKAKRMKNEWLGEGNQEHSAGLGLAERTGRFANLKQSLLTEVWNAFNGKQQEGSGPAVVNPVVGPPLKFNESDELDKDLAYTLAQNGIRPAVVTRKCHANTFRREVKKGEKGIVANVSKNAVAVLTFNSEIVSAAAQWSGRG